MKHFQVTILLLIGLGLFPSALSAERARRPAKTEPSTQSATTPTKPAGAKALSAQENRDMDERFYRFRLNTFLGVTLCRTSALSIGAQFGRALGESTTYIGPEVHFSLFSPGHLLGVLGALWHEMRIYGSPRLSLAVGAAGGVAFTSQMPDLPSVAPAAFFDVVIAQDIDDLVTMRGQFRPGVISSYFAFMMNLNVSFRFL